MVIGNIVFTQGKRVDIYYVISASLAGRMFYKILLDIYTVIIYKITMRNANYFTKPVHEWQRRYEALRASFVDRLLPRLLQTALGIPLHTSIC